MLVKGKPEIQQEQVMTPSSMVGNIISLELDPLNSNNVENFDQDNEEFEEFKDKYDRLVIIDSNFMLFRQNLADSSVLEEIDLTQVPDLEEILEKDAKSKYFPRLSASHRCLTFNGRTYNYETGYCWDFNFNSESTQIEELDYFFNESLPFSNLVITMAQSSKSTDD